jgi:hypothetical protein
MDHYEVLISIYAISIFPDVHVIASLSLPVCPQPSTSMYQIARSKFIACSSPRRMVVKNWVRSCQGMERSSTDSTNQRSPHCLKIFARSVSVLASLHEVASCRCCCHVRLISCNADVSQISVHSPSAVEPGAHADMLISGIGECRHCLSF